jgi:hypothetical protein
MSKAKDGIKVACEEGSCLALRATLKNPAHGLDSFGPELPFTIDRRLAPKPLDERPVNRVVTVWLVKVKFGKVKRTDLGSAKARVEYQCCR